MDCWRGGSGMSNEKLRGLCKKLRLGDLTDFVEEIPYEDRRQYLTGVLEKALEKRRHRRTQRYISQAGFPSVKTLEDYEFDPVEFPEGIGRPDLLQLDFLDSAQNLLMLGAVGTGKTHLAIALGVRACQEGHRVQFFRAADLTRELKNKYREGKAERLMKKIADAEIFILDELGYVPFDKRGSQLLFNVISRSYEQQSLIVTSNLEFGRWDEMFGDDRLTAALVDRLVHHAHILAFSGDSYRLRQAMENEEQRN